MTELYDFSVTQMNGDVHQLSEYSGKVIIIVNTASKCGFTPQLAGLEKIYQQYQAEGLVILGFPCNQFMHQDPKSNEEIAEFCQINYGVTFLMHQKIDVKGKNADPLYQYLVAQPGDKKIKWNFTKFLINRRGEIVQRFEPKETPESMLPLIQEQL